MPEFAHVFNVSALNGANGFRLDGDAAGDSSGRVAAGGGDVNGDGFDDVLIGAQSSDTGGTDRGLAWLVFGAASSPAAQGLELRVAAGSAYRFQGEAAGDLAGYSIANAGDVDGDGSDDLIVGARRADPDVAASDRGASYLVFGGVAKLEAADAADGGNDNLIALTNLAPLTGFRFAGGANSDQSGWSVSGAGDVNGDGFADLLIGAPFADPNGGGSEGASYIVFGGTANLADLDDDDGTADGRIDLARISADEGLRLDGATAFVNDNSGVSVALVGDVNGDGFADVLTGARNADPNGANTNEGAAYLVFGRAQAQFTSAELDLAGLTGLEGTRFDGVAAGDRAGWAVNGLGDVNGDGFADIVIGAPLADPSGFSSGSAYVVFGKSGFGASSDLSALNGANGFRLDGLRVLDYSGFAVSAAGDVNGDGFGDIMVGAYGFDRLGAANAGAAYVVFGKASGFAAAIDLGALDGDSGFRIEGAAAGDRLGIGAAGAAGDVNGDGFDDIVVGAIGADNNALSNSGSTYIVYGHRSGTAVTRIGTERAERINGGTEDDSLAGRAGNDTMFGWEGDDVISGESGNDRLDGAGEDDLLAGAGGNDTFLASAGDDTVRGGSGTDTLEFLNLLGTAITANLATGLVDFVNGTGSIVVATVERLLAGNAADTVTGNGRGNFLHGRAGNDSINGAGGDDTLTGGLGADTLNGSSGGDIFDYNAVAETGIAAATRDSIASFAVNADRIDLASIDAIPGGANDVFVFRGTSAFSAAGQIRLSQSGADTIVEINTTGTSVAEATILLTAITATTLDAGEFIL